MKSRAPHRPDNFFHCGELLLSMGDVLVGRRKPSILVVDDYPQSAELLRELLASRGYRIAAVQHAADAEIEIRRDPPDLILLDVIMPGKSGYESVPRTERRSRHPADPDRHDHRPQRSARIASKEFEAGADDFLSKPISPEELFARVTSLLKLKEFTDELETAESVICTLGLSVESRDPYTEGHCERLARECFRDGP